MVDIFNNSSDGTSTSWVFNHLYDANIIPIIKIPLGEIFSIPFSQFEPTIKHGYPSNNATTSLVIHPVSVISGVH